MAAGIAAVGRSNLQIVIVVEVAISAWNVCVAVHQQEASSRMIKLCIEPGVEAVASVAGRWEFRARMIRIGS